MAKSIEGKTKNGLRYYILPQGVFAEKMAAVVVKRGANHLFWKEKNGREITFPQGTAHFIEHKLFQQKWGDAFVKFSQNGALANAFTDGEKTVYYFSCRERFTENLKLLLDFIQHPFFTEQDTEQEKSIIASEITMYDDDASWAVYYQMLEGMYERHPVKNQIAGTVETIREITAEVLQKAYEAYYTTENMALICTGNVPVREILRAAEMVEKRETALRSIMPEEPTGIQEKYREKQMGLRLPVFQIGWKLAAEEKEKRLQRRILMGMILEMLAGESSDFFQKAYEKGLLDEPLGTAYFSGEGYAFAAFSGKGARPEETAELLSIEWNHLQKKGISRQDFRRIQKKMLGRFLRRLDSVQGLCMGQIEWAMADTPASEILHLIKGAEMEEAEKLLQNVLSADTMVLSVVK